jgi:diguanylate cyclase (GGDEF)-like protein
MASSSMVVNLTGLFFEVAGAVLCGAVFLFLYRQSQIAYFAVWAFTWTMRVAASILGYEVVRRQSWEWLAPYAVAELAFALALVEAGTRSGRTDSARQWRRWSVALRTLAFLPILFAAVYATSWPSRLEAYHAAQAVALGLAYFYNFLMLPRNTGAVSRVFRFSLLVLALAPAWERALSHEAYYDFALLCVVAFTAMAMWSESQGDRIRDLATELDHLRREIKNRIDLDRLTGLFNQSALAARIETCLTFDGVVAVCDMDSFKEINDRYGHLVGDEILRHVGHLVQSSIRQEDEAFRWGGDEFVVLFPKQPPGIAGARMAEMETRLHEFRVRGYGVLPISFSWGTADGLGRSLREALDEADRVMYQRKRARTTGQRAASP